MYQKINTILTISSFGLKARYFLLLKFSCWSWVSWSNGPTKTSWIICIQKYSSYPAGH